MFNYNTQQIEQGRQVKLQGLTYVLELLRFIATERVVVDILPGLNRLPQLYFHITFTKPPISFSVYCRQNFRGI